MYGKMVKNNSYLVFQLLINYDLLSLKINYLQFRNLELLLHLVSLFIKLFLPCLYFCCGYDLDFDINFLSEVSLFIFKYFI